MQDYVNVKDKIQTGDIIAFSGIGPISWSIKKATRSVVSHVGVAIRSTKGSMSWVDVAEATSLMDLVGVQLNRLSRHVQDYNGSIWWLPLNLRRDRGSDKITNLAEAWVRSKMTEPYDAAGALYAGLDLLLPEHRKDNARWFCSEFAVDFLKRFKVLSESINACEWTPRDLCEANIYAGQYQLKGTPQEIHPFNIKSPMQVNERAATRWS